MPLPGGATAVYNSSGLAYYRHSDWLGSSRLASTQARGLFSSTAYAPFGERYGTAGTADASFTGQNSDTTSSLYDFLFREHSPSQGRWISPDAASLLAVDAANPQSWNRYGYALNNPVSFIDSLGLTPCPFLSPQDTDKCGGGEGGDGGQSGGLVDGFSTSGALLSASLGGGSISAFGLTWVPPSTSGTFVQGQGDNAMFTIDASTGYWQAVFLGFGSVGGTTTGGGATGGGAAAPRKTGCFVKGLAHGAVGGLLVAGGTALASTVLAPEVVTAGLLAVGAYGGYQLYKSISSNLSSGNQAGLAYNVGSLLGRAAIGGATSYGVRYSITGETGGPSSLLDFSGLTKLTNPFRAGNSILGNLQAAFAKGPDLLGGGAAIAGGAGYGQGSCQ